MKSEVITKFAQKKLNEYQFNKKLVFYQQYAVPYFGVLSLVAHLKSNAINTDVIIADLEQAPITILKNLKPDIIGISVLSTEHNWLIEQTKAIRQVLPKVIILVGGVHAMLYPQEIIEEADVDLVCHSEGEEVLLNILNEFNLPNPDWSKISGLAYKNSNGKFCKTERAGLVPYNDNIREDRGIYYQRYPILATDTVHRFFSSRGCPYKCSFCYVPNLKEIFKGKGSFVRKKSVNSFISEIVEEATKYSIQSIFFYDDLFTANRKWLKEFLQEYKQKVNIPFMCTTYAKLVNEDVAKMLAEAGCQTVSYGIETGNYELRKNILNKNISNEEIIRCGQLLHKYGMKIQTSNMFCLPDETLEDAFNTIEINIKAKTDFAFSALFMPFPDQKITEYCIKNGYLKQGYSLEDMPYSFLTSSVLMLSDKEAIINVHRASFIFIKWPWCYPLLKKFVRYPIFNWLFKGIFLFSTVMRHKEERNISFWAVLKYAWRMRSSF
jgi:radical SAM superfamily enzyme YgiQ (UPF0313 family)